MNTLRSTLATDQGLSFLRVLRWIMPLTLAAVALLFEIGEHISESQAGLDPGFVAEVVIFAIVGPILIFLTLKWVERLLVAYQETSSALASVNRNLEARIEERTVHLAETTAQLREANRELAAANEELRHLDRLKSEFVSLVSHQLRAPLTNINGALEIVAQESDRLPDSTQQTLRILIHESQRLSWMIGTILDVSRIEAGRLKPRLGPVAMGPLLSEACAATIAVVAGRPFRVEVQERMPPAWADETLLGEVVRNLIVNAIDYSDPDTPIGISAVLAGDRIHVAVTDHGMGVAPKEQERIFRSFYRVSDGSDSARGSGLGLYFAERLIRALGGTLQVQSPVWPESDAPGSRFSFSVPIAEDVPDEPERAMAEIAAGIA